MDLVIGGAYQGKLEYAKKTFHLSDDDIYTCTEDDDIDVTRRCLYHVERYMLRCLRQGETRYFAYRRDAVILCDDIFCGVVPMDPETRAWREAAGRYLNGLSLRADTVTRLFCGLPQRLK